MSAPSPTELLVLARAASTGEHTACNMWCERCKAARKLRAVPPTVWLVLCERLQRYSPNLLPHPMTAPLEVREG